MRLQDDCGAIRINTNRLCLTLASTPEEVREVQRLRYKVFVESGEFAACSNAEGLDADEFDSFCDHLIVRDSASSQVVGTYRLLGPNAAREAGSYYSEGEFDLSRLKHLRSAIVEAGRACIAPRYRSGSVLMLLWAGLGAYVRLQRCEYLMGCASISLADGGTNAAAVCRQLAREHLAPAEFRVTPHTKFPINEVAPSFEAQVPPLLRGYLRSGALVCGDPAWDPDFDCADLFLLLPLERLEARLARRYMQDEGALAHQ
jgi:putative hemolysin